MARPASGAEHIEAALLHNAKTADELRLAQAVLLPLELGLSLEQTARIIGRSPSATCSMRTRFAKVASGRIEAPRRKRQLRNRAHAEFDREAQIPDEALQAADTGGVVVIPHIKPLIEAKLGKRLALSTVYRMLARHGWRKLAPDTRHPQGDARARALGEILCAFSVRQPLRLMFQDEARFGRISDTRYGWAKRPCVRASVLWWPTNTLTPMPPCPPKTGAWTPWCCPMSTASAYNCSSPRSPGATRRRTS